MLALIVLGLSSGAYADPDLNVSPVSYDYGEVMVGDYLEHYFTFENTGTDTVYISNITFTDPAFSIQYTQFPIAPGTAGQLPVKFKPTQAVFYNAKMQVYSNDPDENPFEVDLSGIGVVPTVDGWEWINTGFDYILVDMEFPCGQNQIGFAVGQANTYNGEGIVIKTTDGGTSWNRVTANGIPWLDALSFPDTLVGYAGGWGSYLIKTTDGGVTWNQMNFPYSQEIYKITDVEFRDRNNGVVLAMPQTGLEPHVYITHDGGSTWIKSNSFSLYHALMVDWVNDSTLVAVGQKDIIMRSTDGGINWTMVATTGNPDHILTSVTFYDDQYGLASGDYSHVYKTKDGGQTWNPLELPSNDDILHTAAIWDEDTAWIVGTPELVFKTTDGGDNWSLAYNGNFQRAFYRILFTDNYTGFISASHGVILRKQGFPEIPVIQVDPAALDFGQMNVNDTLTLPLVIKNTGYGKLNVTNIVSSNDVFTVDTTNFSVRPRHEQVVNVSFVPTVAGVYNAVLTITSNDTLNTTWEVSLTGEALALTPAINVSPLQLDFGITPINETNQMEVTVANTGNGVLNVTGMNISDDAFGVDQVVFEVEPGEMQNITVSFEPTQEQVYNGTIEILSNDPATPVVTITVTGEGVYYAPVIEVTPLSLNYDTTLVGQTTYKDVTVKNNGNVPLNVTNIFTSVDVFSVNTTSFDLEPGTSQEIQVAFTPENAQVYQGVLTVESNDPDHPAVLVDLMGVGTIETGVGAETEDGKWRVYPNPARNILYVDHVKDKEVRLYDLTGRLVLITNASSDRLSLDVSSLGRGVYVIKVMGDRSVESKMIKIER